MSRGTATHSTVEHLLSDDERAEFDERGFLHIHGALSAEQVDRYMELHDRVYEEERAAGRLAPAGGLTNRRARCTRSRSC